MRPKTSQLKRHRNIRPLRSAVMVSAVCAALTIAACSGGDGASEGASTPSTIPQPTRAQLVAAGLDKLRVGPESKQLDIKAPKFSTQPRSPTRCLVVACIRWSSAARSKAALPHRDHPLPGNEDHRVEPGQQVKTASPSTSPTSTGGSRRSRSTTTPRPMTARSGTSARTSSTTTPPASSTALRAGGSQEGGPIEMIMPGEPRPVTSTGPRTSPGSPSRRSRSRPPTRPSPARPGRSGRDRGPRAPRRRDLQRQGLRPGLRRVLQRRRERNRGAGPRGSDRRAQGPAAGRAWRRCHAAAHDVFDPPDPGTGRRPRPD